MKYEAIKLILAGIPVTMETCLFIVIFQWLFKLRCLFGKMTCISQLFYSISQVDLVDHIETNKSSMATAEGEAKEEDKAKNASKLAKALVLSIAFSANSGGQGTLIGTTTNIICKNYADQ